MNQQNSDNLMVGIDLGTSQSAIATSTGRLINMTSVVGFPKDFIALKLLKKPIIFGEECYKNRMSVEMVYPLKNGVIAASSKKVDHIKEENAAREYIKNLIALTDEGKDKKIYAVVGTPARATQEDKQAIIDTLEGLVEGVLVVSEPFLVAYGMGIFGFAMIVDIGAGTLDICRMHGTLPDKHDQKTFLKAGNHIDEVFEKLLKEKVPNGHITEQLVKGIKQAHAFIGQPKEKVVVDLIVNGNTVQYDVTEELRDSVATIMPEMVSAIRELITSYDPEYQNILKENIILAGGGSRIHGIAKAIEDDLSDLGGVKVRMVNDPIYAGAIGGLRLAQDMPPSEWETL